MLYAVGYLVLTRFSVVRSIVVLSVLWFCVVVVKSDVTCCVLCILAVCEIKNLADML